MLYLKIIKKGGKSKKSKKGKKSNLKNKTISKKKSKAPTSLSIFPDKSPQLQKNNEPTKLNKFTTKNVAIKDKNHNEYNIILNNRLAYKRPARGQDFQNDTEIIYGPTVEPLKKNNYKSLKKGNIVYYDRASVVLRGPFIFVGHRRGPELLFKIKDVVYPREYLFSIEVDRLDKENLYLVKGNNTSSKKKNNKTVKKNKKNKQKGGIKNSFKILGGVIHRSNNNNWVSAMDKGFKL